MSARTIEHLQEIGRRMGHLQEDLVEMRRSALADCEIPAKIIDQISTVLASTANLSDSITFTLLHP